MRFKIHYTKPEDDTPSIKITYPVIDARNAGDHHEIQDALREFYRDFTGPFADLLLNDKEERPAGFYFIEASWENMSAGSGPWSAPDCGDGWELLLELSDDQQTPL